MSNLKVFAPLQNFQWAGNDFELSPGVWIRRFSEPPSFRGLDGFLSERERDNVGRARHWMVFDWNASSVVSATEIVNLALLSLWLIKSSQTHVAFRFEFDQAAPNGIKNINRLLDRFSWINGVTDDKFGTSELQKASSYFLPLHNACSARGRLNDALILTLAGCWSHRWQVALICQSAVAEALLTYADGPGITRRLATSFACLVESQQQQRDAAFKEFRAMYTARSDIIHGRTHNVAAPDRLPHLARFNEIVRRLWCVILASPYLAGVLDGADAQRKAYFLLLQSDYKAP